MSRDLASNSENFYFLPNSVLNFRKSYQIWGKLAQEQKSYRQKPNWGGGVENTPPSAYRVKGEDMLDFRMSQHPSEESGITVPQTG